MQWQCSCFLRLLFSQIGALQSKANLSVVSGGNSLDSIAFEKGISFHKRKERWTRRMYDAAINSLSCFVWEAI
jgi:hypothetical protein